MHAKRIAAILAVAVSFAIPSGAGAHSAHHVRPKSSSHHALRHHRAHKATVTGCEAGPEEKTWAEWRADMADAGSTPEETEELEVCDES